MAGVEYRPIGQMQSPATELALAQLATEWRPERQRTTHKNRTPRCRSAWFGDVSVTARYLVIGVAACTSSSTTKGSFSSTESDLAEASSDRADHPPSISWDAFGSFDPSQVHLTEIASHQKGFASCDVVS